MTLAAPRFPLIDGPSPLHRVPRFSEALGGRVDIWMKREDLLPLAFGGNKLRNLEFLLAAALAEGADTIITSGRRWSNHCRLTAAAGAVAGLAVHLVVSGPQAPSPGPGIRIARQLGATVHELETADRAEREARVAAVATAVRAAGGRPYVIEVGGSGMPGVLGQVAAAEEALAQITQAEAAIDTIVLPSATGGTQAGLLAGIAQHEPLGGGGGISGRPAIEVVGVVVARAPEELRPAIERMLEALVPTIGRVVPLERINLEPAQLGDGYGRPTAAATEAQDLLGRSEGILVDPIYTAKALAALIAAVRAGRHDGRSILFWHAGGTLGVLETLDR